MEKEVNLEEEHTTGCSDEETADSYLTCLRDYLSNKIKGLDDGKCTSCNVSSALPATNVLAVCWIPEADFITGRDRGLIPVCGNRSAASDMYWRLHEIAMDSNRQDKTKCRRPCKSTRQKTV